MKDLSVLLETNDFIAVNKPAGMLTIPDRHNENLPSLYSILSRQYEKIFIVHRLDKLTSGVIIFAKNAETHQYLSGLFQNRNIKKEYTGFVSGKPVPESGKIDAPIMEHPFKKGEMIVSKKGKPSVTEYKIIETFSFCSYVRFQIHSGRTHQIRVHAKYIGHPLLADAIYGTSDAVLLSSFKKKFHIGKNELEERPLINRTALHADTIAFEKDGEFYSITAPLPKDMNALLKQLQKNA